MIKHIVIWKLKDDADGFSKDENIQRIKKGLEKLTLTIKEIKKLEVGINFNQTENAYDIILYSEFNSKDALNTYQVHPDHIKFKEFINNLRTDVRVVDYKIA